MPTTVPPSDPLQAMSVTEAVTSRISVRAFLSNPVPEALVRDILDTARWSPSGGNLQPWKVIAVAGHARQAVIDAAATARGSEEGERPMYPANLWEPYRTRRFALGEQMYDLLGLARDDKAGRLQRLAQNTQFFGAPVGLFFVIDERMGWGQWAHLGMFMQTVALVAQERGLSTCMQEFWALSRKTLKAHFALDEHDMIYCGMALGYADTEHPVNSLRSERASVDEFARFAGF
jgi:nitroreductase